MIIPCWATVVTGIALFASSSIVDAKRQPKPKRVRSLTGYSMPSNGGSYRNCAEARAAGAAPVRRGSPGYSRRLDRDGDGVGCE